MKKRSPSEKCLKRTLKKGSARVNRYVLKTSYKNYLNITFLKKIPFVGIQFIAISF